MVLLNSYMVMFSIVLMVKAHSEVNLTFVEGEISVMESSEEWMEFNFTCRQSCDGLYITVVALDETVASVVGDTVISLKEEPIVFNSTDSETLTDGMGSGHTDINSPSQESLYDQLGHWWSVIMGNDEPTPSATPLPISDSEGESGQVRLAVRGVFLGRTALGFYIHNGSNSTSALKASKEYSVRVTRSTGIVDKIYKLSLMILIPINTCAMSCTLDLEIVFAMLKKPIAPSIGFGCQYVLMPLVRLFPPKTYLISGSQVIEK